MLPRFTCFVVPALAALTYATATYAQPPQASPQSTTKQPAAAPGYTLSVSTQLVVVDVTVTDSDGNPIHNLKLSDFTLLEQNISQHIKFFEEHTALSAAAAAKLNRPLNLPPGVFTNYSPVPTDSSVNILLLDTLNTPSMDQAFVRDQLRKYLKSANPNTRIAIFGLSTYLSLLQGFTSDPELLKTAMNKKNPQSSVLLDDQAGGSGEPDSLADTVSSNFGSNPDLASVTANLQQFEAERQSFQLQLRARYTLDALNELARYLVGIPGRKNLIWFSGSFPINILPDGDLSNPFAVMTSADDEFRETVNLLARSRVAVYPIDARGLMNASMFSATNSGQKYTKNGGASLGADTSAFLENNAAEQTTMLQMAEETGGQAYVNTNGLSQAVTKAIDSGSSYYTLFYSPGTARWDGAFRKIQVKLQHHDYTLSYRRGYYADDPNSLPQDGHDRASTLAEAPSSTDAMRVAMMRGGPDPTQIILKVRVVPAAATPEGTIAKGNALNPSLKIHGPYRRYFVDLAADPSDIAFKTLPNGNHQGALQFKTYVYDQDGGLVVLQDDKTHSNMSPAAYAKFMHNGVFWHQEISVPVKGDYSLRIGIHDLTSDHIGAVEIPVSTIKNLPPIAAH